MSDIYVKFGSIPGEATHPDYMDNIVCVSMRHAIDMKLDATTSARKVGNSRHGPIELTHAIDSATPGLHHAASSGTNTGEVVITRLTSSNVAEVITLQNVYVVRIDVETPLDLDTNVPGEEVLETFALDYSSIQWDYRYYDGDIELGSVAGGWDLSTLSKV